MTDTDLKMAHNQKRRRMAWESSGIRGRSEHDNFRAFRAGCQHEAEHIASWLRRRVAETETQPRAFEPGTEAYAARVVQIRLIDAIRMDYTE